MLNRDKVLLSLAAVQAIAAGFYLTRKNSSSVPPAKPIPFRTEVVVGNKGGLRGAVNAPYTLVEFGDYQCPPCARAHPKVVALLARYPRQLRFQFRHMPLERIHFYAPQAALDAEVSRSEGAFWETHDALYKLDAKVDDTSLASFAPSSKVAARDITAAKERVRSDALAAETLHITSTPSFFLCCPDGKVLKLVDIVQAENYL